MANKSKRLLIIITEGATDTEFYKKVLDRIKKVYKGKKFLVDEIKYISANGIGNMHRQMLAKFKYEICGQTKYNDYYKTVCFCYDLDVFNICQKNPPINREKMKKDFCSEGADKIICIEASNMIEDFFLYDIEGIKKFLNLKKSYKLPHKKSLDLIKQMFKDGSRIYYKGSKVIGLMESLDFSKILPEICDQISELCVELGEACCKDKCKKKK